MRRWAALLLLAALVGGWSVLGVGTARPASAHAVVVGTTPADRARLDVAPDRVTIEFDENVSLSAGYFRVLDADGRRVDTGAPRARDAVLTLPLRADLPDAGYLVTYRVVSADSHPISGAWSFVVGDGEPVAPTAADGGAATDPGVATALPAARWLGYLGLALALGIPVFLLTCWPAGWTVPALRRLTAGGLVAVASGAVLSFLVQGPYAAGEGLGSVVAGDLFGTTFDSDFGRTLLARIVLTALLSLLLRSVWRAGRPATPQVVLGAAVAVGLVLTFAAVGHPLEGAQPVLAVAVSGAHVATMSCWLGGLAALVAGVLAGDDRGRRLRPVLPRWSQLAFWLVTALVLTGVLQSVREVGGPDALVHSTYGWLLVAKVAVVVVVLAVAALSRDWVQTQLGGRPRRPSPRRRVVAQAFAAPGPSAGLPAESEDEDDLAGAPVGVLRRTVLLEAVGALVVLGVSAVLVGTPPAKAIAAPPVAVTLPLQSAGGTAGNGRVEVSLTPASPGPTTLHVYVYDDAGRLIQPRAITVDLSERDREIGPLPVHLVAGGPGHYVGDGTTLPSAGTWTLTVTVRLDEFTARTATTDFAVR